jgi:hypothetical protein
MRNTPESGTIVMQILPILQRRLPAGWKVQQKSGQKSLCLRLSGPDRRSVTISVLASKTLLPSGINRLLAGEKRPLLVLASYLSRRAREMLVEAGASYADATGNIRVEISSPAIFLEGQGAEVDPARKLRPLGSLRGGATGRVVRALVEIQPPLGVRDLAKRAGTSLGTASRVVTFLEHEALLARDAKKRIATVEWQALLSRWTQDYALTKSNQLYPCLEPRGLSSLWTKLAKLPRYAVTGSPAGTGIAPTRIAIVYVDDPEGAAETLGLVPAEAGANVWLLRPYDGVVFTRTRRCTMPVGDAGVELITVSAAQAVVDLLSSPGRGPQEAEALLREMEGVRNGS